ncbi:NADPH-adrenodoxin reductase [Tieghemiomyces parasiticus]|uniref:NADPH:adrenodoxin oxidoreductase, mitochondrial n=1 Tax=Tieghemiomyces parasiticus TaxID=78921 RepID=A0A9W8AF36_9FUNG|nr:NADPH-adrenodoxin reductase [Tieghemiomyces parasiticus]
MATRLAIVGSGPAGFYTAARLLGRAPESLRIDMFESLPIPHGLVRYGVAPDHPEVKTVINRFDEVAASPAFRFFGNVTIGRDLTIADLRRHYDGVVLAYGAAEDRPLGLADETTTRGVISARAFVGWYNGHPDFQHLAEPTPSVPSLSTPLTSGVHLPDLANVETAVIVGHGNVALDVARVLLTPVDVLARTDMPEYALEHLRRSRVRHVHLLGRRGPLQVQFTTKELREMFRIAGGGVKLVTDYPLLTEELNRHKDYIAGRRPLKRLLDLLYKEATHATIGQQSPSETVPSSGKTWHLDFLRTPHALEHQPLHPPATPTPTVTAGDDPTTFPVPPSSYRHTLTGLVVAHNRLVGPVESARAELTGALETIPTQLLMRSIGYRSTPIDPDIPFDGQDHIVPNVHGKVVVDDYQYYRPNRLASAMGPSSSSSSSSPLSDVTTDYPTFPLGMYVSGWLKRGPKGVIVSTMNDAFETAETILVDLNQKQQQQVRGGALSSHGEVTGVKDIKEVLQERQVRPVTYQDWKKVERHELAHGTTLQKPREKVTHLDRVWEILRTQAP